ncbi:MAG TPA: phosphoserine phosphatase SerB [Mycobacteriales bacterium]|nr:phosphoserine phosphatase SerB [Mycobacteriales bacterium]
MTWEDAPAREEHDSVMEPHSVLVTVTGRDRPGVTSALFAALAGHDVEVLDVEQVVIRGRLVLGVLVALHGEPGSLRRVVNACCDALGMESEVLVADPPLREPGVRVRRSDRHHVIVLGRPLRAGAVGEVAHRIADLGGNIDTISRLSHYPVTSLELMVSGADPGTLRSALVTAATETGIDIAVERAGLHRRAKRLLVLDVDSTLIRGEVIEMLAAYAGCAAEVSAVTARAMAGEMDFAESLRARVALLAGLPADTLESVRSTIELGLGARTLVRTLKRMGYRIGIVSGGFSQVVDGLAADLGLDFAAANTLEIADGVLTGRVVGEVLDRAGKARALVRFAEQYGVPLSQTVAVGDGANDIDMLNSAGLGIAFNAKPVVQAAADTALSQPYLDAILFILGISRDEVEAADAEDLAAGGVIPPD